MLAKLWFCTHRFSSSAERRVDLFSNIGISANPTWGTRVPEHRKIPLHEMDLKVAEMSANVYRVVPSGSFRVGIVDETAASRVWRVRQVGQLFLLLFLYGQCPL
jgi:hypothetical protein